MHCRAISWWPHRTQEDLLLPLPSLFQSLCEHMSSQPFTREHIFTLGCGEGGDERRGWMEKGHDKKVMIRNDGISMSFPFWPTHFMFIPFHHTSMPTHKTVSDKNGHVNEEKYYLWARKCVERYWTWTEHWRTKSDTSIFELRVSSLARHRFFFFFSLVSGCRFGPVSDHFIFASNGDDDDDNTHG